jgi:lipoyl(octanoyl) transferase
MAVVLNLAGLTDYRDAHHLQQHLLEARIEGSIPDVVLLLQHSKVITVGRARDAASNIVDLHDDTPVVEVERGGNVTWHGPGQLVAYPIVALEGKRQDLHLHLRSLEEAVIRTLAGVGVQGVRDPRNTGVWIPRFGADPLKVASVGIACKRWVTWHGVALNVDVDLASYDAIRPCGLPRFVMTTLAHHTDAPVSVASLARPLGDRLLETLELQRDDEAAHRHVRALLARIGGRLPPRPKAPEPDLFLPPGVNIAGVGAAQPVAAREDDGFFFGDAPAAPEPDDDDGFYFGDDGDDA